MKKWTFIFLALLLLLCLCAGCQKKATDSAAPLAMINGQPITRSLFSSELHARREGNTESLPSDAMTWLQLKAAFLDQMVNRLLLEQEAVRRQVTVVDADVDSALEMIKADWPQGSFESVLADRQISIERFRQEIRHNLLTEMMAKKVVSPNIEITEQDIQSFYRQNPELFSHPEQVRARQILIRTEAEAAEILTRILTGTSFIDMARAHSIAPEAQKGGDLGYFGRGQMPRVVEDACFALDVRQTSDIIKSDYGYHLFFIENRRAAAVTPLNNARAEIVGKLREEKLDAAWPAFIASLKASAQIEINEPMLASIKQDEI